MFRRTNFRAPIVDLVVNLVADRTDLFELFVLRTSGLRGIGKAPMQSFRRSRKDRAFLRVGFVADGDDVGEKLARFENIENGLGFFFRNVDADLLHHGDREGIESARLEPGTVRFECIAAQMIEPRFGHLTARAVVHADEEHSRSHDVDLTTTRRLASRNICVTND